MAVIHRGESKLDPNVGTRQHSTSVRKHLPQGTEKAKVEELRKFRLRHWKPGTEIVNPDTGDVGVVQPNGDLFLKWRSANPEAHGGSVRLGKTPVPVAKRKGPEPAPYGKPGTPESMARAKKSIEELRKGIR